MNSLSSFRNVVWRIGINQRRVPSRFIVPMKRSMTAMLPCFPTAPNRGLIVHLRHQALKPSHENCPPLSLMRCFGDAPEIWMVLSRKAWMSSEEGTTLKTAKPMTRRE